MAEKRAEKCAYLGCDCPVVEGSKYCSRYCESMFNQPPGTCQCGHGECAARKTAGAAR